MHTIFIMIHESFIIQIFYQITAIMVLIRLLLMEVAIIANGGNG